MRQINKHFVKLSRWWTELPEKAIYIGSLIFSFFLAYFVTTIYKHTLAEIPTPFIRDMLTGVVIFLISIIFCKHSTIIMSRVLQTEKDLADLEISCDIDLRTGAYSSNFLEKAKILVTDQAIRNHCSIICIIVDLDNFKEINDRYGHLFGDACLKNCVEMFKKIFRGSDYIIRYGGDEFVILGYSSDPGAMCNKMDSVKSFKVIYTDEEGNETPVEVGISYGCGFTLVSEDESKGNPHEYAEFEQKFILKKADSCLYDMKNDKRSQR